eukprot:scaffold301_cov243-Pinguiococcus_pyrenoidosus.AAC.36
MVKSLLFCGWGPARPLPLTEAAAGDVVKDEAVDVGGRWRDCRQWRHRRPLKYQSYLLGDTRSLPVLAETQHCTLPFENEDARGFLEPWDYHTSSSSAREQGTTWQSIDTQTQELWDNPPTVDAQYLVLWATSASQGGGKARVEVIFDTTERMPTELRRRRTLVRVEHVAVPYKILRIGGHRLRERRWAAGGGNRKESTQTIRELRPGLLGGGHLDHQATEGPDVRCKRNLIALIADHLGSHPRHGAADGLKGLLQGGRRAAN